MRNEREEDLLFADALSTLEEAKYAILGVSFDGTACHRKGAREAPFTVRGESYNFETYQYRHDIDLADVPVCDMGTLIPADIGEMREEIPGRIRELNEAEAFPMVIGGEHSLTPFVVRELVRWDGDDIYDELKVVVIDAHLDFRREYLGNDHSHACVTRRIGEMVGFDSVLPIGVRSMEKEERSDALRLGLEWIDGYGFDKEECLRKLGEFAGDDPVYLSIDMDGLDPAFAPGVGTPEPFGLSHRDVLGILEFLSDKVVGMDVVEICPPYDNGNTSALGAKLVRELIALRETERKV